MIKKIILEVNKKEYSLTANEAKNLYEALKEIFEEKTKTITIDKYIPYKDRNPYTFPNTDWWRNPIVYCSDDNSTLKAKFNALGD